MSRDPKDQLTERWASFALWDMLRRRPGYRQIWVDYASRNGIVVKPDQVSQRAVCMIVTKYLYERGELGTDPETLEGKDLRQWKDRISRVARGTHLSAETLRAIIEAFEMDGKDAERLWLIHSGVDHSRVVIGELPEPQRSGFHKSQHDTLVIMDEHYMGLNGLPRRHETTQIVVPRVEGLTYFPIRFNGADLVDITSVELLRGGKRQEPIILPNGTHEYRIEFLQPLTLRDTASIKYAVDFDYQSRPSADYRRAIYGHLDRLFIYVKFDPDRVPSKVWWTEWQSWEDDSDILRERLVDLDDELSVHHDLFYIKSAVVGFRWEWNSPGA
jgi:hypothetical protein